MIQWSDLGAAVALVLVFEGLMPLIAPRQFRVALLQAGRLEDRVLRALGLGSMLAGVLLLYWVR